MPRVSFQFKCVFFVVVIAFIRFLHASKQKIFNDLCWYSARMIDLNMTTDWRKRNEITFRSVNRQLFVWAHFTLRNATATDDNQTLTGFAFQCYVLVWSCCYLWVYTRARHSQTAYTCGGSTVWLKRLCIWMYLWVCVSAEQATGFFFYSILLHSALVLFPYNYYSRGSTHCWNKQHGCRQRWCSCNATAAAESIRAVMVPTNEWRSEQEHSTQCALQCAHEILCYVHTNVLGWRARISPHVFVCLCVECVICVAYSVDAAKRSCIRTIDVLSVCVLASVCVSEWAGRMWMNVKQRAMCCVCSEPIALCCPVTPIHSYLQTHTAAPAAQHTRPQRCKNDYRTEQNIVACCWCCLLLLLIVFGWQKRPEAASREPQR